MKVSVNTKMISLFACSVSAILLVSCGSGKGKTFDSSSSQKTTGPDSGVKPEAGAPTQGAGEILSTTPLVDNRTITEVLCQEGPKVIAKNSKGDFQKEFGIICANGNTNEAFKTMLASAYDGTGEPKVTTITNSSDENFVTNLVLGYALKLPIDDPSQFADYRAHNIFAAGIKGGNSEMKIDVESRQSFPGKASVEQVILKYNLMNAEGAGIFDTRRTEFNTYLLLENTRDVVVSTEVLLDEATNEQYHLANAMNIGVKDSKGSTYVVFLINLVIKNRIDPARMQKTMTILNTQVAKMVQAHVAAGKK